MVKLQKNFLTLVLFSFIVLSSFTTDTEWPTQYGVAKIDANYCVTIDTSKPLESFYKIDISDLNFASEVDAQKVFGAISNNYLSYRVHFSDNAAYLKIHADRTKEMQDVIWWNDYIQSLCKN